MAPKLPYTRKGHYGTVRLDHAACGRGYVVEFKASEWVRLSWGDKSRWHTFEKFHTALAYFYALSGLHEAREDQRRPLPDGDFKDRRPARAVPLDVAAE